MGLLMEISTLPWPEARPPILTAGPMEVLLKINLAVTAGTYSVTVSDANGCVITGKHYGR